MMSLIKLATLMDVILYYTVIKQVNGKRRHLCTFPDRFVSQKSFVSGLGVTALFSIASSKPTSTTRQIYAGTIQARPRERADILISD